MTIIVGYTDGETTWLASDRQATDDSKPPLPIRKLLHRDGWAWGFAGDGWTGRVLNRLPAEALATEDPLDVVEALLAAMQERGWQSHQDPGAAPRYNWQGVLARAGRLWELDSSGFPYPIEAERLAAVGSGEQAAMAVWWLAPDSSGEGLVRAAVECANAVCPATCGLGVDMLELRPGGHASVTWMEAV